MEPLLTWLTGLAMASLLILTLADQPAEAQDEALAARAAEIAGWLLTEPRGLGRPGADREAWGALAQDPALKGVISRAEKITATPLPESPDNLFIEFSRTGNRTHWQDVAGQRRERAPQLALAECLEWQGRFLPAIEETIRAICTEQTWVMPAHDTSLANFRGETVDIDLGSSALAWKLAEVSWLLGDRLSPETRELLQDNIERRILTPYLRMLSGEVSRNWWLSTTNNWNAVCLAGVTGAALAQVADRDLRAQFVAAAEDLSRNFLAGFTSDGYCSEGLGYWNYGFGNYVSLSELIWQATGGRVDLLARPEALAPALFGERIQIIGSVAPAFADCAIDARPGTTLSSHISARLALGLPQYALPSPASVAGSITDFLTYAFPNSTASPIAGSASAGYEIRTFFDQAGILIGRPAPGSSCRMGVALKGGHNAEHHNHNDLGSYVVVLGNRHVLLDPGAEVYTARTFSSRRYESKLLNSFGHPVPVVAGKLQREGAQAKAQIVETRLTDLQDTIAFELRSAYDVPALRSLRRTFTYSREGDGALTVVDAMEAAEPVTFSTALITLGDWRQEPDGSLLITDGTEALRVEIESSTGECKLESEQILEDGAHPTRIGIALASPTTSATVTVHIAPTRHR